MADSAARLGTPVVRFFPDSARSEEEPFLPLRERPDVLVFANAKDEAAFHYMADAPRLVLPPGEAATGVAEAYEKVEAALEEIVAARPGEVSAQGSLQPLHVGMPRMQEDMHQGCPTSAHDC